MWPKIFLPLKLKTQSPFVELRNNTIQNVVVLRVVKAVLNGSRSDELSLSIDPYRSPWAVIVSLRLSDDVNDNNFLRETRIVCFFRSLFQARNKKRNGGAGKGGNLHQLSPLPV